MNRGSHTQLAQIRRRLSCLLSRRDAVICLIIGITASAYLSVLRFDFVYDDTLQIVHSPAIHSWRYLPLYFATDVWHFAQPTLTKAVYYRPVFLTWLLINHQLFGLSSSWWHASTLFLHLLCTILTYVLVGRFTTDRSTAALAALFFGLTPVHIEAVAWASGATEPLYAILLLLAFLSYSSWRTQALPDRKAICPRSLALYALALLAKETAVVLPAMIFACEWAGCWSAATVQDDRTLRGRLTTAARMATPFVMLFLVYIAIRATVLGAVRFQAYGFPLWTKLLSVPSVLMFYFKTLLWPMELSPYYDMRLVARAGLTNFLLPAMVCGLILTTLFVLAKRSRVVALAAVWLCIPLLPVLNIGAFGPGEVVHDRYLYIPSLGFSLLLAIGIRSIHMPVQRAGCHAHLALGIAIACLFGLNTARQVRYWQNDLSLFRRGVEHAPENISAKHNLALALGGIGLYNEAIPLLREVLAVHEHSVTATFLLGRYCYTVGSFEEADFYLTQSVQLRPTMSRIPYAFAGLARMELGRLDSAEAIVRNGIEIKPQDPDSRMVHYALGSILKKKGEFQSALNEFNLEVSQNRDAEEAKVQIDELRTLLRTTR